ncbi:MAG TPA: malectin domain-containing carbohydrate-binding protein, partial [Segetibacter sp.]
NLEPYTNSKLTKIAGTDEDALYLKEQSSNGDKKPFRYEFPVTNGAYAVRLHFAEVYWGAPGSGVSGGAGSRVMSVSIENRLRLVNLDVSEEVGGATAIVKNIPVTVTDGKLDIKFSASVNRPMVVAVEVYSFRSSSSRPADIVGSENNLSKVRAYPIPLQKTLKIQFPSDYKGNTGLQILDALGRTYEIGKVNLQPGGSNMEVNISKFSLKPGYYYLKITSDVRPVEVIKLIVL